MYVYNPDPALLRERFPELFESIEKPRALKRDRAALKYLARPLTVEERRALSADDKKERAKAQKLLWNDKNLQDRREKNRARYRARKLK